jgi:threonine dehydrogenase-like Zn-dependent dehydrogenase
MKAINYTALGIAAVADLPMPELAPGRALIRVKASGVCGTDLDVLFGRYGEGKFPVVPGHEFSGIVEAVAADVHCVKVGARVVVDPNLPCGHCRACLKGLTNLCTELKAYGVTHNGGFAEFSVVKADQVHDIGDMPFDMAALAEPLACVLNGLGSAGLRTGSTGSQNALVFGAGPIGLLLALSLKSEGVKSVTIADINENRLAFAADLGLKTAVSGSPQLDGLKRRFDFVADATGIPDVVGGMADFTADGGTILIFGVCAPGAKASIEPFEFFRRQLKLVGSHSLNRSIPQALEILRRDGETMGRLISHRLAMAEVVPFLTKKSKDAATMKIQFVSE